MDSHEEDCYIVTVTTTASLSCVSDRALIAVFSHLEGVDLLAAECVCRRWKTVIGQHVWPTVTRITEAAIGYPNRDFLSNFVAIAERIPHVSEFVNIFRLVDVKILRDVKKTWRQLRRSVLVLSSKPSPSAVFPLDMLKDVVDHVTCSSPSTEVKMADFNQMAEIQQRMTSLMDEFNVNSFTALRIDQLSLHELDVRRDPFHVRVADHVAKVDLLHESVKRLVVGCVAVKLQSFAVTQDGHVGVHAMDQADILRQFPRLEHVEVESVQLKMSPRPGGDPSLLVDVDMRSTPCLFTAKEFKRFLAKMADRSNQRREAALLKHVKGWLARKLVGRCALHLHSEVFDVIKMASLRDSRLVCAPFMRIGILCLENVDSLHLRFDTFFDDFDALVVDLRPAFRRLKTLAFSFARDTQYTKKSRNKTLWDAHRGASVAKALVRSLLDSHLPKLESLSLDFLSGGPQCPAILFDPMKAGTGSLPALTTVECRGMPVFPFLMAIVATAPKLRHLVVTSQPFVDDQKGFEAMASLLASLKDSEQLACVLIHVYSLRAPTGVAGLNADRGSRQRPPCQAPLDRVSEEAKRLYDRLSSRHRLVKVAVSVKYHKYRLDLGTPCRELDQLLATISRRTVRAAVVTRVAQPALAPRRNQPAKMSRKARRAGRPTGNARRAARLGVVATSWRVFRRTPVKRLTGGERAAVRAARKEAKRVAQAAAEAPAATPVDVREAAWVTPAATPVEAPAAVWLTPAATPVEAQAPDAVLKSESTTASPVTTSEPVSSFNADIESGSSMPISLLNAADSALIPYRPPTQFAAMFPPMNRFLYPAFDPWMRPMGNPFGSAMSSAMGSPMSSPFGSAMGSGVYQPPMMSPPVYLMAYPVHQQPMMGRGVKRSFDGSYEEPYFADSNNGMIWF